MKCSGTEMGLNVSIVQRMLILNGAIFCHHARASACITSVAIEISCVFLMKMSETDILVQVELGLCIFKILHPYKMKWN